MRTLVRYAAEKGMEKGLTIRVDSTATETSVHYPRDSRFLQDCIRVIVRLLAVGKELEPVPDYPYSDHQRVVTKRCQKIRDTKKDEVKVKCYKDLYRRKTGNDSMCRALRAMLADTPLVRNLDNPNYMKILLDGKANLEELFAVLEAAHLAGDDELQANTDRILPGFRALMNLPNGVDHRFGRFGI